MFHEMLERVAREFVYQRARPFANNAFGKFVRHDLTIEAKKHLIFLPFDLKVKASVGSGNWAAVPWLAFFDPLITTTATKGFYVVYLVNAQTEEIFISLNQGTTAVYREFGETRGQEVLRRRARDMVERIPAFARSFDQSSIELGSSDPLPRGYEAGHAFGRRYLAGEIAEDSFYDDFSKMLSAYEALIDLGGTTPFDFMQEESESSDIHETRRYILSRRIERAPNVRSKVLEQRGPICEACGYDPISHVAYLGPISRIPLDIHHSSPISALAEGESRRYKIPDDFLVLCPNCHRMIHKQNDPSDLEALKDRIQFNYVQKINPI